MLFNKQKRIKYLGFDDFWFVIIGIFILSFIIDYLFNNSFVRYPFGIALINWGISLMFTIINWFISRSIIIFLRKKYPSLKDNFKRIALVIISLIATILLVDLVGGITLSNVFADDYHPLERLKILLVVIVVSITVLAIYEAIYFYVRLAASIRQEEQAKQVIVEAKLEALRNQAQPHFLFNSLNTLRDIIDQDSKEDAKEFVNKMADVYRFILESGNSNLTSLREELKFAKAYVHIQLERFGDNLQIEWNIPEASMNSLIVPMSLQLLLENAIKHNVISKAKPLMIRVEANKKEIVISNKIQIKSTQLPSTKLGLKNIDHRYKLISKRLPNIQNSGTDFVVSLPLLKTTDRHEHSNH
jgi:sensor histidine kinase YesM